MPFGVRDRDLAYEPDEIMDFQMTTKKKFTFSANEYVSEATLVG
jgi:hypothetical protein